MKESKLSKAGTKYQESMTLKLNENIQEVLIHIVLKVKSSPRQISQGVSHPSLTGVTRDLEPGTRNSRVTHTYIPFYASPVSGMH